MRKLPLVLATILLATVSTACALTIQVDYSYDAAAGNFFGLNPLAKAAVNQAAADLSAAVTSVLGAVPDDVFTGTNGDTSATFDWDLRFQNPSAPGQMITLQDFSIQTGVLTVYVGMRPLSGATLGQGGTANVSVKAGASGFEDEVAGAVAQAEAASNAVMPRGAGPVVGSLSGSLTLGNATANYNLRYGALVGTLWFDNDANNDGAADPSATLANYWHYDPNTGVATGKNDLYSVALHEMMHVMGIGISQTWTNLVSGTTWLGPEAKLLNGSGANLIASDGDHIRSGLLSPRLVDGFMQEVVMDPSLTVGTRKYLTLMDLAFLHDIGYASVPEPSVALMVACGVGLVSLGKRRRR
ncbi:hypothetical protein ACXR0O_10970 [Verrucomicrobiota bacterium sgz303538]